MAEPALRLWLRYAEREGAVYEEADDQVLVLLPERMQSALGLAEEVAVTAEPDVARHDGALLLIPGHPAVDSVAAAVLEEGDVGWAQLAWPTSVPPSPATLQARARERFGVDHGRMDAAGEPAAVYLPVLRLGALLSYSVSLDHRFREQEEVWVDGQTGIAVEEEVRRSLEVWPRAGAVDLSRSCLVPDLGAAVTGADAVLRSRAGARLEAFARQADDARRDQLDRADSYFEAALASITQRRATAAPERQGVLDAQADATRAERARRRAEIEETFRATYDLTPYRAHLLAVPALVLPVDVRRGNRTFPFSLTWILPAATFADPRCPHCLSGQVLVAGRSRLGCRACLPPSPATAVPSPAPPPPPVASAAPQPLRGPEGPVEEPSTVPAAPRRAPTGPSSPGRPPRPASKRVTPRADRTGGRHLSRVGERLAVDLWRAVGDLERWPRKAVEVQSPLAAAYRLYGPPGPAFAIGVSPDTRPRCVSAATLDHDPRLPEATTGVVAAGGLPHLYTLRWRLEGGKPVVAEVLPFAAAQAHTLPPDSRMSRLVAHRLFAEAPRPPVELDPVAAAVWADHLPAAGLPLVLRALAAWWRVRADVADPLPEPAGLVAAGVVSLVAAHAGRRRLSPAAATGADPAVVAALAARLQPLLRLSRERPW